MDDFSLIGQHVRLEPLGHEHVASLVRAAGQDRATYGWTFVPEANEAAMRLYVDKAIARRAAGAVFAFATFDQRRDTVVGSTRFAEIERFDWPEGDPGSRAVDSVEIGWTWLAADAQRTAINTEAKYLMARHAFEVWGVYRLWLKTDSRNERSRQAIERIGARFEGILRSHARASVGGVRDTAVYAITEADWPAARAALEAKLGR
ncbi:MAG: GNAT family N-acetyltransferase [Dehalococcoidia bacterium]